MHPSIQLNSQLMSSRLKVTKIFFKRWCVDHI